MNKKEIRVITNPESNPNINRTIKLINNSFPIQEEIKSIQRSIALLRQDIREIVREEMKGALHKKLTSMSPQSTILNEWSDFWYYQIGVNVIPANTKDKEYI